MYVIIFVGFIVSTIQDSQTTLEAKTVPFWKQMRSGMITIAPNVNILFVNKQVGTT